MVVEELPVGRRFQLKCAGPIFMKVELKHTLADVAPPGNPPGNGVPVINLNNGFVFWMKADARTIVP